MPKQITITSEELRQILTNNPDASQMKIAKLLGVGYSTLLKKLATNDVLNAVWSELRGALKVGARSPRKAAKNAAPPRNGHAKGGISNELLRKIQHEFNHVVLYNEKSEHFDEVAQAVAAIK